MGTINRWDKKSKSRKDISCPQIILAYNKNMGGVDFVDMLIALYRIKIKTRRWYIKIFWHLVDICKVNAWNMYRRHCQQKGVANRKMMSLLQFSRQLASALIHANKIHVQKQTGRPSKRASLERVQENKRKKAIVPTPCQDVRYDQLGHWPEPVEKKDRCRLC